MHLTHAQLAAIVADVQAILWKESPAAAGNTASIYFVLPTGRRTGQHFVKGQPQGVDIGTNIATGSHHLLKGPGGDPGELWRCA